jgi:hypothetical protein
MYFQITVPMYKNMMVPISVPVSFQKQAKQLNKQAQDFYPHQL